MSETNTYSVKQVFDFWRKCERFYGFVKKIFWTGLILNLVFWAVYIPVKDENSGPLFGFMCLFMLIIFGSLIIKTEAGEKAAVGIFLVGCAVFIFSYFIACPIFGTEGESDTSFLTTKSEKLISYGSFQLFHIPFYHKHFNYNIYQQRSFVDTKNNSEIIVIFKFDFDEFFEDKDRLSLYYPISRNYFDILIDAKVPWIKLYIEKNGIPKKISDLKNLNDKWLVVTSFKIELKPTALQ